MKFRALRHLPPLVVAAVLFSLAGCASVDRNIATTQQAVTPVPVGEAEDVPASDLALALLRAGFTREDILEHGPALHTALATSGGAQFRRDRVVEAVLAVHSSRLYVTSRTRGTFVLPIGGSEPPT